MTARQFNEAIKAISDEDDSGFMKIYNEFYSGVYFVVFDILRNKEMTEDIVSDVFYKIYNNSQISTYIKNPKAWVYTIARNAAKNHIKKEQRYVGLSTLEEAATVDDCADVYERITFEQLLREIDSIDKEILMKHIFFGYGLHEIAKEMQIKYNTVKSKYLRVIKKFKEKLLDK